MSAVSKFSRHSVFSARDSSKFLAYASNWMCKDDIKVQFIGDIYQIIPSYNAVVRIV